MFYTTPWVLDWELKSFEMVRRQERRGRRPKLELTACSNFALALLLRAVRKCLRVENLSFSVCLLCGPVLALLLCVGGG